MTRVDWARLGYVRRAHGLRGRLALRVYLSAPPLPLEAGTKLLLGRMEHVLTRCRVTGPQDLLVDVEGIHTRQLAEELVGSPVSASLEALLSAGQGVPLPALVGMSLPELDAGDGAPKVTGYQPVAGNPMITVGSGALAVDIPLALMAAEGIDWKRGVIHVELPEGYMETLRR